MTQTNMEKRLFSHSFLAAGLRAQYMFCSDSAFDYLNKRNQYFQLCFPYALSLH